MLNPRLHESGSMDAAGMLGSGSAGVDGHLHTGITPLSTTEPVVIHTSFNISAKEHERSELDGMSRSQRDQWTLLERSIAGNAHVALTKQELEHQVSSKFSLIFMTPILKFLSS